MSEPPKVPDPRFPVDLKAVAAIKPFGNQFVLYGIPEGVPLYGCVRGEDLAAHESALRAMDDAEFLRWIGIEP